MYQYIEVQTRKLNKKIKQLKNDCISQITTMLYFVLRHRRQYFFRGFGKSENHKYVKQEKLEEKQIKGDLHSVENVKENYFISGPRLQDCFLSSVIWFYVSCFIKLGTL